MHIKACFHYERGKKHSLFVLLIFFALASILTACFNRRSIKETKNALFHARRLFCNLTCNEEWYFFTFICKGSFFCCEFSNNCSSFSKFRAGFVTSTDSFQKSMSSFTKEWQSKIFSEFVTLFKLTKK